MIFLCILPVSAHNKMIGYLAESKFKKMLDCGLSPLGTEHLALDFS